MEQPTTSLHDRKVCCRHMRCQHGLDLIPRVNTLDYGRDEGAHSLLWSIGILVCDCQNVHCQYLDEIVIKRTKQRRTWLPTSDFYVSVIKDRYQFTPRLGFLLLDIL